MKQFIAVAVVGILFFVVMNKISESPQPSDPVVNSYKSKKVPRPAMQQAATEYVEPWSKTEIANPSKPHAPSAIIAIFNDNELMGETQFSGSNIIEGFVVRIETGFVSGAYAEIGDGYGSTVKCVVKETDKNSLLYLHRGQKVTFQ